MKNDKNVKKHILQTGENSIVYTVSRTGRKTIGITINEKGDVKVSAPLFISEKEIIEVVRKKAAWITEKLNELKKRNLNTAAREYVSGEKLLYLGSEYTLKVVEKEQYKPIVFMQDDNIIVYIPRGLPEESRKQVIKDSLVKWYKQCFNDIACKRVKKYSYNLMIISCRIVIKDQKTRWGSCSSKGNINLNWRLVMAPLYIIDYVIVHELCHMRFMNHSKDFWNLVESIVPNYRECRRWLRENGYNLKID